MIFDTDIGIDDAMALLFAHYSPEINLVAITTLFGNASVENTTKNALYIKQKFKIDAPVFKGAEGPLGTKLSDSYPEHVHGKDGLGNIKIAEPRVKQEQLPAAQAIIKLSKETAQKISIISIGGLTNIASALTLDPGLANRIEQLIVMGGAFGYNQHRGNVTPVAEANIANDPQAADLVFSSNIPTTIVGLDVSHEIKVNQAFIASLDKSAGQAGAFISATMKYYLDFHYQINGVYECPLHDSSAIAYLINPDLFTTISAPVRVVTSGIAHGQTIHGDSTRDYVTNTWRNIPPSRICTQVDSNGVLALYKKTLQASVNDNS
ncbi:MAG: nucleoside hydrolase [Pseudohongiellaceae bacterium]